MSSYYYSKENKLQPIENILELFKELILAYNLSPKLNLAEKNMLKKAMLKIDGVTEEVIDSFLHIGLDEEDFKYKEAKKQKTKKISKN